MKTIVCFSMKSLVGTFMPPACEVVSTNQPRECFVLASLHQPYAVVLFSEMFSDPAWEWIPSLRTSIPTDTVKVIVPLHQDEQLIKRILAVEQPSNTYVLSPGLTYQEIRRQLEGVLGLYSGERRRKLSATGLIRQGSVYTLCSHGGAGVTTFAINYPVVLARKNPNALIAVIDMDAHKSDLTHFFQLSGHQLSLYRPDLISLDAADHRNWDVAFKPSEFARNLFYANAVSRWRSHEITVLLAALRKRFDYIFVDYGCCAPESETLHQLLQEADGNLFFARSDPFSLHGAANWARRWHNADNLRLLVSHHTREEMSVNQVKESSQLPPYWLIPRLPSGRLVQSLLTRSVLVEELFPPKEYVKSLHGLAEQMVSREGVKVSG